MKRVPLLLAALVVLSAPAAAAEGVLWVASLDEAAKQAKERGSMIFIGMVIDGEVANDEQKAAYRDPGFVKVSRDFVCVLANPMQNHGKTRVKVDGEDVERCREAPSITCADHVQAYNDVLKNYANLNTSSAGDTKFPFQFVIDADGKVLLSIANGTPESGFDPVAAGTLISALKSLVTKYGRGLSADEYESLRKKLEEGLAAKEKGDYKDALKLFEAVVEANEKSALADQARDEMGLIDGLGRQAIAKILETVDEDPVGAVMELEKVKDDFEGTEASKQARAKIAELKKQPEVKKALETVASRKAAEKLLDRAEAEIEKKNYAKGLELLDEVVEKYAGLPQAEKAKARADELRADEAVMAEAREQEAGKKCKGWLSMGRSFAKNGMIEKARAQFQKIIDEYPGTSFAEEAAKELAKLEGK